MKTHFQNLNEGKTDGGSILSYGRGWWYPANREVKCEWAFGRRATFCHAHINFGADDSNDGVQIAIGLPWLFSVFLTVCGVWRLKREFEFGIGIHNGAIWLYTGSDPMGGWSKKTPWWDKTHSWSFPWELSHHKTEILEHKSNLPFFAEAVYIETSGRGKKKKDAFERMRESDAFKETVSETYSYRYVLKNGTIQDRTAKVYVDRMTWRARWWPIIPHQLVRTCINIQFNEEVGEGTVSWKGGCTGCGYEMLYGETPLMALRRMELERKFGR